LDYNPISGLLDGSKEKNCPHSVPPAATAPLANHRDYRRPSPLPRPPLNLVNPWASPVTTNPSHQLSSAIWTVVPSTPRTGPTIPLGLYGRSSSPTRVSQPPTSSIPAAADLHTTVHLPQAATLLVCYSLFFFGCLWDVDSPFNLRGLST
jgi:hypothetical protein